MSNTCISVTGLGYVGLPVAVSLAQVGFDVIGFDKDRKRINELKAGKDRTLEVEASLLDSNRLFFTNDPTDLATANFHIVAVPTPITKTNEPDLIPLTQATRTLSKVVKHGDIVVFESTVFPGCTEEVCKPLLETGSGLLAPRDFAIGYSPERINPGDREHTLETVVKIISAQTEDALEKLAEVYGTIVRAGVYRAKSIQVAEAAKVIENIQRDVNIALINEFSEIFSSLQIDTEDVLSAAKTKWNFLSFKPGLVGGHCIGVDPYYLTYKAKKVGVDPKIILAGRRTNNEMSDRLASYVNPWLRTTSLFQPNICILGATFKENVPDLRNSQTLDLVRKLQGYGANLVVVDPYADLIDNSNPVGDGTPLLSLEKLQNLQQSFDVIVLAVAHDAFKNGGWPFVKNLANKNQALVIDVKSVLDRNRTPGHMDLQRL